VGTVGSVRLGPPVPDPDKIVCLGLNYRDHASESAMALPPTPIIFAKFRSSLAGPNDPIVLPGVGEKFDYEAELAVVIGRRAKNVRREEALEYVAGAMAFNDVTARDIQHATSQWTAGKAIDSFAPCGPALVLGDELGDLQDLAIRASVNGLSVQGGHTSQMIFSVAETIEFLSSLMTLEVGDIIATGTPAGVGISRDPQVLLSPGDVVEVEIEGIGRLVNVVQRAGAGVRSGIAATVDIARV
jgi:2-keto-4-pentenoate hydratase/2-oxohepta-3-ene-1,7-dioic acid hydratase in catechol pathway